MELKLNEIQEYYSKMNDTKLERIAKFEIASLRPEIVAIVEAEIKKRGLNSGILLGIEVQKRELSLEELNEFRNKIVDLDCPICNQHRPPLVGTFIRKTISYLIFTQSETRAIISCKECAEKENKKALIKTLLFGWWGFPWGFIKTPQALIGRWQDKQVKKEQSEQILNLFINENIGEIKTNWESETELVAFIKHKNNMTLV